LAAAGSELLTAKRRARAGRPGGVPCRAAPSASPGIGGILGDGEAARTSRPRGQRRRDPGGHLTVVACARASGRAGGARTSPSRRHPLRGGQCRGTGDRSNNPYVRTMPLLESHGGSTAVLFVAKTSSMAYTAYTQTSELVLDSREMVGSCSYFLGHTPYIYIDALPAVSNEQKSTRRIRPVLMEI